MILMNLVEKSFLSDTVGMNHHLILVTSLFFDKALNGNLHLDILMWNCFLVNWKVSCLPSTWSTASLQPY